jgi:hypothetical protein
MKTPREILLERHQAAMPKLDTIRHEIVNVELKNVGQASRLSLTCLLSQMETGWKPVLRLLWRELVWPCRQVWAGLAAVWILIFIFNVSQRDPSELMAQRAPPPALEMSMTFPQQEKLLAELMGPSEPRVAVPLKPFLPRPSSERRFETLTT